MRKGLHQLVLLSSSNLLMLWPLVYKADICPISTVHPETRTAACVQWSLVREWMQTSAWTVWNIAAVVAELSGSYLIETILMGDLAYSALVLDIIFLAIFLLAVYICVCITFICCKWIQKSRRQSRNPEECRSRIASHTYNRSGTRLANRVSNRSIIEGHPKLVISHPYFRSAQVLESRDANDFTNEPTPVHQDRRKASPYPSGTALSRHSDPDSFLHDHQLRISVRKTGSRMPSLHITAPVIKRRSSPAPQAGETSHYRPPLSGAPSRLGTVTEPEPIGSAPDNSTSGYSKPTAAFRSLGLSKE